MPGTTITELATMLGTTTQHLRDVVQRTLTRLPRQQYYVFRITGAQQASLPPRTQPRMIVAFATPDDALSFAQRNGYGSTAQLRSLNAADLIGHMLADTMIGSVLFLHENGDTQRPGFGPGLKISRTEMVEHVQSTASLVQGQAAPEHDVGAPTTTLEEHIMSDQIMPEQPERTFDPQPASDPLELTAAHYDALQFGINFTRRAEFRAALAQAVEHIVATYEPPAGSLDRGPRSIFATTAVELWLKEHGFPHVQQRRWIDVSGEPGWGGAVELCELDGGTENHLLIQLLIHIDESGRQYIKQVNVTA